MNATRHFLQSWMEENVGRLPAETEVSIPMLAQQFEEDADAAGYGREVRRQELGDIQDAIQRALHSAGKERRKRMLSRRRIPLRRTRMPGSAAATEGRSRSTARAPAALG